MSFKENYDKVFLSAGIALGLASAGAAAWFYINMEDKYALNPVIKSKDVEVDGIAKAESLSKDITADYQIKTPKVGPHAFYMFVGPVMYLPKGSSKPLAIEEPGGILHPPVPNSWFLENGLTDVLKYSDALYQDPDGDGFTILEEYEAGTNPKDPASHPLLVNKLTVGSPRVTAYSLLFSGGEAPEYSFRCSRVSRGGTSEIWRQSVKVGDKMGKAGIDEGRYILEKVENKEFQNERTGIKETDLVAEIKDLKPSKASEPSYEIRKGNKYAKTIVDTSVSFTINAGDKAGQEIKVESGSTFKIPGDDKMEYTLESVDTRGKTVTITYDLNNEKQTKKLNY